MINNFLIESRHESKELPDQIKLLENLMLLNKMQRIQSVFIFSSDISLHNRFEVLSSIIPTKSIWSQNLHQLLLVTPVIKLRDYGMDGSCLSLISSYLGIRKQRTVCFIQMELNLFTNGNMLLLRYHKALY